MNSQKPRSSRLARLSLYIASMALAACGKRLPIPADLPLDLAMKPSISYLHLLQHTPFFTALSTDQLRWTIAHSLEWQAPAHSVVARCGASPSGFRDDVWILLDGHWTLEVAGKTHPAGHADAGKWFSAAEATGDCRLVTTEDSYVMRISGADFKAMLAQGFAFQGHLKDGQQLYRQIFSNPAQAASQRQASASPPI